MLSIALSFALGLLIAVMRMSNVKPLLWLSHAYLEFFRNTPLLVQIFFWYFGSYQFLPKGINDWLTGMNFEFAAAVIALTVYTSAFIAEDIRSGVRAIPKEQMEAARSSGFSYLKSMYYIIIPQAVRITIPPLINQFLNLTKNSPGHDHRVAGSLSGPPGELHLQGFRPAPQQPWFIWRCPQ